MFAWNINNIVLSIFMVAEKRGKKEKKLFVFWNHFNFICQVISFNWWKESLNSDGEQFHQYQQKQKINSHLNSLNTKTRGSVGWACVAHLSFCFEET